MSNSAAYSPKLAVLNEAANWIGANTITNADTPETGAAKTLHDNYLQAVREVLELRRWASAARRLSLPAVGIDGVLYPGLYGYRLPAACVRMNASNMTHDPDRFIEGSILYSCLSGPAILEFNAVDTESVWTPHLVKLMGVTLADKCSFARKDSAAASERLARGLALLTRKASQIEGHRYAPPDLELETLNYGA